MQKSENVNFLLKISVNFIFSIISYFLNFHLNLQIFRPRFVKYAVKTQMVDHIMHYSSVAIFFT